MEMPEFFDQTIQTWFSRDLGQPTPAQLTAWPTIARGDHTLLLAPTGSGKTLAAFLTAINRLMFERDESSAESGDQGVSVLYISPLKALGVDVERNLQRPLLGIKQTADEAGQPYRSVSVAIRSGDTDPAERRRIAKSPPDILITTPESLFLILTSKARTILASVDTIIIDEIHSLVASKRGSHLFVSLERLERLRRSTGDLRPAAQRIGLSATQRPLEEVARLLGGLQLPSELESGSAPNATPRNVTVLEAGHTRQIELTIEVPVEDMSQLVEARTEHSTQNLSQNKQQPAVSSIWPAIHPRLVELIRSHRSTMIFVNSRRLAERLAGAINEEAGEEIALAHHGSLAKDARFQIEEQLKQGRLPAIVATSSLELGIDMGAVDLVIQVAAPPSIASGLQRIGRSGHKVDEVSKGIIFPRYRGDLLASAAAAKHMLDGDVEETFFPRNPLDVLAQQVVATIAEGPVAADEIYQLMLCSAPFADLPRSSFDGVLDLLSGRYPSDDFHELRPRINWDRISGLLTPRRDSQRVAILNAGTIPDRGLYGVFLLGDERESSSRVGELDEEMVHEIYPGDVFLLGASSWRVAEITQDRVLVLPAPGVPGRMPFWKGEGPGRPLEFGQAIGSLARELLEMERTDACRQLVDQHGLAAQAAENLLLYLEAQVEATGEVPSDRTIIVEVGTDEIGDWRVVILSSFGARVHAPLATAVTARLREVSTGHIDVLWTDEGIVFRLPAADDIPATGQLFPQADEIEDILIQELSSTALFASHFRENAARALLLPRHRPGKRTPLWLQRRRSADLLKVASRYPDFPMLLETYRECLQDVFDLPGLKKLLAAVHDQSVAVQHVQTESPSPFAAAVLFSYTGNFIYDGDAPLAERRAQSLTLDHLQLQELLGEVNYRELLDADIIADLSDELQRVNTQYPVRSPDGLHQLLLNLGDLSRSEVARRCTPDAEVSCPDDWIRELISDRRIVEVTVAGEDRLIATEDVSRYRDALAIQLPAGIPDSLLAPVETPLRDLISRFARTHGPFRSDQVCQRFGLDRDQVETSLITLTREGRLISGQFTEGPESIGNDSDSSAVQEWCDTGVLRTLKQRSLARVREQIRPVSREACARFQLDWHGIGRRRKGPEALLDVIEQLQGLPLPASCLERDILPARISDYQSGQLDELCAAGEVIWQGCGTSGSRDGRIALYLADSFDHLCQKPVEKPDASDEVAEQIREFLRTEGAAFFHAIHTRTGGFRNDVVEALWRLVWNAEVTNDTLAPVRSLLRTTGPASRGRSGRSHSDRRLTSRRSSRLRSNRASLIPGTDGRWSLVRHSADQSLSPTERRMEQVRQLLDRIGIVTRESIVAEKIPGGFSSVYPILRAMEDSGQIRRGYFIEGLGAAQFAAPGAAERLRNPAVRHRRNDFRTLILSAVDPACPYGSLIPWPKTRGHDSARPLRVPGALVMLRDGFPVCYLNRTRDALTTFLQNDSELPVTASILAEAVCGLARERGPVMLTSIDGIHASQSELVPEFMSAGFQKSSSGLRHQGL